MIVYMNTAIRDNSKNERLKELVTGAKLTQAVALTYFNRGFGIRGLAESTWKSYFCSPETTRWREFSSEYLVHAEKLFGPMQK